VPTASRRIRFSASAQQIRIHLDHEGDDRMTLLAGGIAIMHRYLVATRLP
jgi:hypothetical protein